MADKQFNLTHLMTRFEQSLIRDNDIALQHYVQAFGELSRLFSVLGVVFSFVESDVADKTSILSDLHSTDSDNYATVQSMILYECFPNDVSTVSTAVETVEVVNGTTGRAPLPSVPATEVVRPRGPGARTVLRLHRALNFLIEFVKAIYPPNGADESAPAKSTSEQFRVVYQDTLARHHTWWIRQSVKLASHAVPNRQRLLDAIFGATKRESCGDEASGVTTEGDEEGQLNSMERRQLSEECVDEVAQRFLGTMRQVYERVQRMYEENNLLELP